MKRLVVLLFAACLGAMACSDDARDSGATAGQAASGMGGGSGGAGGVGGTSGVAGGGMSGAGGLGGIGSGGSSGTIAGASGTSSGAGAAGGDAPLPDASADAGAELDAAMPADPGALWIATDGRDENPGTEAAPLLTLAAASERAMAGSTIMVKAGTYASSETVGLRTNGDEASPIRIFAAPGVRPVFDFSGQPRGESSARGIQISGSYWHIRGVDVINAGDNCIHISGSHNTIELVNTYGCSDTGVQITANSSEAGDPSRAAHNTVINCDSHDNYDEANAGENADGFAAKLYIGPGNVFRGCRAWNNADDGWDLFASDDVVVIEDCWAIANGKIGPAQDNTNGDGNGFKLGGAARAGDANMGGAEHEVARCISIENRACGFVRNNNTVEPSLAMCGGRGDTQGLFCSLGNDGAVSVDMTAAQAIAAERETDGSLPPLP
jgi:hypothetical protein